MSLTTGSDTFTGGAGDDSISGARIDTVQTLNSGDTINGGAGSDTLTANLNAGTVAPTITNVETIQLTALGVATVDFVNTTGVTSIVNSASTGALTVDNVVAIAPVTIQNTAQDTTVTFKDAAVAGTTDTVTLNLTSVSGGIITLGGETTAGAGFETVNIVATGTNVTGNVVFGTTATTLNISGTGSLDIDAGAEFAAVQTIDASGLSGALAIQLADRTATSDTIDLTITTGAGNDTVDISAIVDADVDNITVNLGAGNDRLVLVQAAHNADTANSMDGGAGTDTLSLGIAMTSVVAAYVSNFEVLEFNMTADVTQDMDFADGMNIVSVLDAVVTADLIITDAANGLVVRLDGALLSANDAGITTADEDIADVRVTNKTDTANDTFTLEIGGTLGDVNMISLDPATTYETVTVVSSGTSANAIQTIGTSLSNMTFTGATALSLLSTGSLTGVADAGAMTGAFTTTTAAGVAITVVGGSGNDVLSFGAADAVSQIIRGGAGNDTITAGAVLGDATAHNTFTVDGGAGSDTINVAAAVGDNGTDGLDAIFGITGGAGFDFITLGTDVDVSHDIVSTATTLADADKITGFESGATAADDDFDYNGTVSNDGVTTIVAHSNTTLAAGLAADADATVYIVTTDLTGAAATDLAALVAATTVEGIAAAYATFEASFLSSLGTVTGLDAALGSGESVLLNVQGADDSVILRITNTDTSTANTLTAAEVDLVAIMVAADDLVVGDFI